ncbi:hypothetical protein FSC37_22670 [Piscinibacter aquaticus]|uniref:Tail specific protease domain-containing protein n=1 Tax=Piscinibacter aquaticus TaxID=392597 RepID=A0A5C6TQB5_9BURK|nr:hypothetical protein FSC37_22670 [Piscinibacter aquaticus]
MAFVEGGSPSAVAGIERGDELVNVNDISVDTNDRGELTTLLSAPNPTVPDVRYRMVFRRAGKLLTVDLAAAKVVADSVPVVQTFSGADGQKIGYLLFNEHTVPAELRLITAVTQLRDEGINELALDLRYNQGGVVYVASQLATMIAGIKRTEGKTFATYLFNDKRAAKNSELSFLATACLPSLTGSRCSTTAPLPTLDLRRVYILTQESTCSASEAIINGLRGVDMELVLIGERLVESLMAFLAPKTAGSLIFQLNTRAVTRRVLAIMPRASCRAQASRRGILKAAEWRTT